jgi:hypothetical protein
VHQPTNLAREIAVFPGKRVHSSAPEVPNAAQVQHSETRKTEYQARNNREMLPKGTNNSGIYKLYPPIDTV